jgi:hypothetical protein
MTWGGLLRHLISCAPNIQKNLGPGISSSPEFTKIGPEKHGRNSEVVPGWPFWCSVFLCRRVPRFRGAPRYWPYWLCQVALTLQFFGGEFPMCHHREDDYPQLHQCTSDRGKDWKTVTPCCTSDHAMIAFFCLRNDHLFQTIMWSVGLVDFIPFHLAINEF